MVKHMIIWTLKDTLTAEEKATVKQGIKVCELCGVDRL